MCPNNVIQSATFAPSLPGLGARTPQRVAQKAALCHWSAVKLTLSTNFEEMWADLSDKVKARVPIAVAIAMNATVSDVYGAEQAAMRDVFDNPTPFTLNGVRYTKATPTNLSAEVYLDDTFRGSAAHPAAEYLIPEIDGGVRAQKRSEYILSQADILPPGMSAVPGVGAVLDEYGNMSTGQIQQILSALRVSESISGHTSNRRQGESTTYFVASATSVHGRHLHPGIYQRVLDGVLPILAFVSTPHYTGVLDFAGVADETTSIVFEDHLREQLAVSIERAG